jgi:phosphoribosyl 1,2-cyclic phosphodiesterase
LIRFASLGSGSRGNGTLLELGDTLLLVDCGFTLKQAEARLRRLDVRPGDLAGILVTHEHADHIGGVAGLAHKYSIPVHASYGTLHAAAGRIVGRAFDSHAPFRIGDVTVCPVIVPHDAREPTQFVFEHAGTRLGVVSDLGHVTPFVVEQFAACQGILMESNYDPDMLWRGRYPEPVKRRIDSPLGHLSNAQSAAFLAAIAHPGLSVVVGHVSEQNNHPEHLHATFESLRPRVRGLEFATQAHGAQWVSVDGRGIVDVAGITAPLFPEYASPAAR